MSLTNCVDLLYLDPPFNSKHNYAAPIGSYASSRKIAAGRLGERAPYLHVRRPHQLPRRSG